MLDTRSVLCGVTPKTGDLPQWKMKKAQIKKPDGQRRYPQSRLRQHQTPPCKSSTETIENNKNNYFTYTLPTGTFVILTGKTGQNVI